METGFPEGIVFKYNLTQAVSLIQHGQVGYRDEMRERERERDGKEEVKDSVYSHRRLPHYLHL